MKIYEQIREVSWLNTPKGTVWIQMDEEYIQPEDESLRDTPLGVSLDLLDDDTRDLFQPLNKR